MKHLSGRVVVRAVATLVAACLLVGVSAIAPSDAIELVPVGTPVATFDYEMPKRYGMDESGDGLIDSFTETQRCTSKQASSCVGVPATNVRPIVPSSWDVTLNACGSGTVEAYDWRVHWTPTVTVETGQSCSDFTASFPGEGTYEIDLRVKRNGAWGPWTTRQVVVQDFLIVSLGDSYGSGEGVPDKEVDPATLSDVATAFNNLGAATQELADLGPCASPFGANFDACVNILAGLGEAVIDRAADLIKRLDDDVCDVTKVGAGFDAIACVELLGAWVVTTVEQVGTAVSELVNGYISKFIDVYNAAAEAVSSIRRAIRNFENGETWQDRRCHRSANAGSAIAAKRLEDVDPHSSVTFIHLACSGATITAGLLGPYAGVEGENETVALAATPIPPQVEVASALVGDRDIDALYVSIGGNDASFAPIIMSCLKRFDCTSTNPVDDPATNASICPTLDLGALQPLVQELCERFFGSLPSLDRSAADLIGEGLDALPGLYDHLSSALQRSRGQGGLGMADELSGRVYLSEYVDALHHHTNRLCSFEADGFNMLPGVSAAESAWLVQHVADPLMATIASSAATQEWTFVDGIYSQFAGHGYCAEGDGNDASRTGRFLVRLQESFLRQADQNGAVHPNRSGHLAYAQSIYEAMVADLFPAGTSGLPRRPDQLPYADAGAAIAVNEGETIAVAHRSYDGDLDPLTYAWSSSDDDVFTIADTSSITPHLHAVDDGTATLSVSIADGDEGTATDSAVVTVSNVAPTVDLTGGSAVEGSPFTGAATYSDPGAADTHTASISWGDGTAASAFAVTGGTVPLSHTYIDEGSYTVSVTVTDDDGAATTTTASVAVENAAPVVGPVIAPAEPHLIGSSAAATASFTDAGVLDTHTASWDWGDGSTSAAIVNETAGSGTVSGTHTYNTTGVFTITLTVTDNDGGIGTSQFTYVVVYDPAGGFVVGAGWIDSPAGAWTADPTLTGPAQVALVSKYQKGVSIPDGNTTFRFRTADFEFTSTSYKWLVVSGSKATYKGSGSINGTSGYAFLISVIDGATKDAPDRLRVKVWSVSTDEVIYDNLMGAGDDADPSTSLTSGSITVTAPKKH